MKRAAIAPADPAIIFRWDLDKTYLRTEFATMRQLWRTAFQKAKDKVAYPGATALLRALRKGPDGRTRLIYFVSASPPQLERVVAEKFALDGIEIDGIYFKDNLRNLTKLLGRFSARNQGRMPKDEQEFKTFVREMPGEQLSALGVRDVEKIFVSSRDGEPYVIRYGQNSSPMGGALPRGKEIVINPKLPGGGVSQPVVAHEKTGVKGQRYVVFGMGQVELVDEGRFQQLIPQ